ncbi:MAG: putative sensor with domain [Clostridia bacterium]|jgi:two-component system sensor histidine kinase YesM|nr:putative sensor with domain [Clostridia bacterium]
MMKDKLRSQKTNLFIYYAFLITTLLFICFFIFYIYYRQNIYKEAKVSSNNLCTSISSSIASELEKISTISMNTIYSNTIQKNLLNIKDINYEQLPQNASYASSRNSVLNIYDTISAIIGPFQSVTQINLYSLEGASIGSGFYQYTAPIALSQKSWYEATLQNKGSKYITTPEHLIDLPSVSPHLKEDHFISLCRIFFDGADNPQGIVEVIQNCSTVFSFTKQAEDANPDRAFYIYNDRGELVYPYKAMPDLPTDYNHLIYENNLLPLHSYTVRTADSFDQTELTYAPVSKFGWKVVVTQPKSVLLKPLYTFTQSFIIVVISGIFITLLLCFFVADKLTSPLRKLTFAIQQVNINNVLEKNTSIIACPNSSIEEIHTLFNSFNSMYHKLCLSSQEILTIKSEETRAKMSATQAMINPHFLYNNLTTISILAEEHMTNDIIFMCNALCDYFRYITTHDDPFVTLETEALYAERYIACMQIRFGSDLTYTLTIPEELKTISIPKLIIQPIIENAFKYGFNTPPPWRLTITAEVKEGFWLIHMTDNGIGMADETLNLLHQKLAALRHSREITSLKIGGMGLKNVYLRMLLLYNKDAVFTIQSTVNQGTCITIGGPIFTKGGRHD